MSEDLDPTPLNATADLSVLDLLTWIGEGKWLIAGVTAAVSAASLAISLALPDIYTARTTLMPPSGQQSSAAAALASLAPLTGLAGLPTPKSSDDLYISLMRSDAVLRPLTESFDLRQRLRVKTFEEVRGRLPQFVKLISDKKSGVITVEVDDEDPAFAARLANAHVTELDKLLGRLAVSEAQQRRVFFEKQLQATNAALLKAEEALQSVQQSSGLIVLDKQAEALIQGAAQLRALIAEREIQLRVLRTTMTDQSADVLRLSTELDGLRSELRRVESRNEERTAKSPLDLPVRGLPAAAAGYVRAVREVKYQEAMFQSLLRQLEVAKLDQAKEGASLQQIDVAQPPDRKSKPSRAAFCVVGFLLALFGSTGWVVVRRYHRRSIALSPSLAAAWDGMRQAWGLRRARV